MTKTTAIKLVAHLAGQARDTMRESRNYPRSRDYFLGLSRGYLSAARKVAHEAYGLCEFNARDRRILGRARQNFEAHTGFIATGRAA